MPDIVKINLLLYLSESDPVNKINEANTRVKTGPAKMPYSASSKCGIASDISYLGPVLSSDLK